MTHLLFATTLNTSTGIPAETGPEIVSIIASTTILIIITLTTHTIPTTHGILPGILNHPKRFQAILSITRSVLMESHALSAKKFQPRLKLLSKTPVAMKASKLKSPRLLAPCLQMIDTLKNSFNVLLSVAIT